MDVSHYRNGDAIPQVTDPTAWANLTTGAWCYYNNDVANGPIYGKLYNWYAVNDPRGLAPQGWHVPSNVDWRKLIKCIDPNADTTVLGIQSLIAGGAMKETGTTHWSSPNTGATNSSGFSGLPSGFREYNNGPFYQVDVAGYWWSSIQNSSSLACALDLGFSSAQVDINCSFVKTDGLSVRVVKD